jgi:hypothetical protein
MVCCNCRATPQPRRDIGFCELKLATSEPLQRLGKRAPMP